MKAQTIKQRQRSRILHLVFDNLPQRVGFRAEPANGAGPVEVVDSAWLFRRPPVSHALAADNELEKGVM